MRVDKQVVAFSSEQASQKKEEEIQETRRLGARRQEEQKVKQYPSKTGQELRCVQD